MLIFLFDVYKYSTKDYAFLHKKKKSAKVLFQKTKPKPKPTLQLPKPKPKPQRALPAFQGIQKPAPKQKPEPPKETVKPTPKKPQKKDLPKKPEKMPEKKPEPKQKKKILKKTGQKQEIIKKKPEVKPKPTPKPKPLPKPQIKKSITPKPRTAITLTDLSKGFLDYTEKQGANLIQYTKSAHGKPTEEQLKHERYIRRVFDCIETILSIRKNTLAMRQKVYPNDILTVLINIVLNTDGKIADISIAKTSGLTEFDQFMLHVIHESNPSFPPVPSYLSTDKYYLPIKFIIPAGMVMVRRNREYHVF